MLIGLLAVRELDGPLRDGDAFQSLAIHRVMLADEPAYTAVRRQVVDDVLDLTGGTGPVRTFAFSPAYLDGVFRRNWSHLSFGADRLPPDLGVIVGVWRRP